MKHRMFIKNFDGLLICSYLCLGRTLKKRNLVTFCRFNIGKRRYNSLNANGSFYGVAVLIVWCRFIVEFALIVSKTDSVAIVRHTDCILCEQISNMAKLVDVYDPSKPLTLSRRQLPLVVDESLTVIKKRKRTQLTCLNTKHHIALHLAAAVAEHPHLLC